jgi:hypothetical protein
MNLLRVKRLKLLHGTKIEKTSSKILKCILEDIWKYLLEASHIDQLTYNAQKGNYN